MKAVVSCFLCMLAAGAGIIGGFAMGASLEEILLGMLALFAACLLYLSVKSKRGGGI